MTTTMKIKYVGELERAEWTTIESVRESGFTDQEIVEMVNRYQDTQKHAIAYRQRAQIKTKLMKERLAQLEKIVAEGEEEEG